MPNKAKRSKKEKVILDFLSKANLLDNQAPAQVKNLSEHHLDELVKLLQDTPSDRILEPWEIVLRATNVKRVLVILDFLIKANLLNDQTKVQVMNLNDRNLYHLVEFLQAIPSNALTSASWEILVKTSNLSELNGLLKKFVKYKSPLNEANISSYIKIWEKIHFLPFANELDDVFNILHIKGLLTDENLKLLENYDNAYLGILWHLHVENMLTQETLTQGIKWRNIFALPEIKKAINKVRSLGTKINRQVFDYIIQQVEVKTPAPLDIKKLIINLESEINKILQQPDLDNNLYSLNTPKTISLNDEKPRVEPQSTYYEVCELISKNYEQCGLDINPFTTDIVEYMVLEFAGVLSEVQGLELRCTVIPNSKSTRFNNKAGVSIQFSLDASVDEKQRKKLNQAVSKLVGAINVIGDGDLYLHNAHQTKYSIIIDHEEIVKAHKSSSLLEAAGDITRLPLSKLEDLKERIKLYDLSNKPISLVVNILVEKIDQAITILQKKLPIFEDEEKFFEPRGTEEETMEDDEKFFDPRETEEDKIDPKYVSYHNSSLFVMNKLMSKDIDMTIKNSVGFLKECKELALVTEKEEGENNDLYSAKFKELMSSYTLLIRFANELINLGKKLEKLKDVESAQAMGYQANRDEIIKLANKLNENLDEVSEIISKIHYQFDSEDNKATFKRDFNIVLRNDLKPLRSRFDDFCRQCATVLKYMGSSIISIFTGSYRPYLKEIKVNSALNTMVSKISGLEKMIKKVSKDDTTNQTDPIEHVDKSTLDDNDEDVNRPSPNKT